jgi:hypothetical protein
MIAPPHLRSGRQAGRWRALAKRCIEVVEEGEPSFEPVFVRGAVEDDAEDDLPDPGRIRPAELPVLNVDVVDDLRDLP